MVTKTGMTYSRHQQDLQYPKELTSHYLLFKVNKHYYFLNLRTTPLISLQLSQQ
jgi:hypothetical protein